MSILISAFEPFGGRTTNTTELVLQKLMADPPRSDLTSIILPVEFNRSWSVLKNEIERVNPRVVLSLGEAEGRSRISVERVALNWANARIADNSGYQPSDVEIIPGGETALLTDFDSLALSKRLNDNGSPAEVSLTAGAYVCNHLMYHLLQDLKGRPKMIGGFVHFPLIGTEEPKLTGGKWDEDQLVKALRLLVEELAP